ncbi:MAG: 2-C-methyl-D-erythritol 4-phosphate cytidylyltransferase [Rudaea sp.]
MATTDKALWCVVPAAGRGTRFGGEIPKQYLPIAGKPLLLHTLERLAAHPRIAGLMVVLAQGDTHWSGLCAVAGKPVLTADGGGERADSVSAGLRALRKQVVDDDFILVHDAARPCVLLEDISRLIETASAIDGGLLATPVRETLKRADVEAKVVATQPRDAYWRALTPQMFRYGELLAALDAASAVGVVVTDEAMAMERMGSRPKLIEGSQSNIKVTTPEDFTLAEFILSRQASNR